MGVQTAPPPSLMFSGLPHVSGPFSVAPGTVSKRHTGSPSSRLNAPTQPEMAFSLPAGPMSTTSS